MENELAKDEAVKDGPEAGLPAAGTQVSGISAPSVTDAMPEEPAQVDERDEYASACAKGKPRVALVGKYDDRIAVQLKSQGHLDRLIGEHGETNVEVQP